MNNDQKYQDEIDFKEVLKTPIRWFGFIYPYFIIIIVIAGIFWIKNLDFVFTNVIKPSLPDSTKILKELTFIKGSSLPGVDVLKLTDDTQALIKKGSELFKSNCSSCHGTEGQGDGPAGAALDPKPRNFHSSSGWTNGMKISGMYKTLQEGVKGSGMASYDYLPIEDRFALIYFIRSFSTDFPSITNEVLVEMDSTFSLSKGRQTPNQIPVKVAQAKLAFEGIKHLDSAKEILETLKKDNIEGFEIFEKICCSDQKAIMFLSKSNIWKTSEKAFLDYVYSEIPQNGFRAGIMLLNKEECQRLFQYLIRLLERKEFLTQS
jgi:hypothetical protein